MPDNCRSPSRLCGYNRRLLLGSRRAHSQRERLGCPFHTSPRLGWGGDGRNGDKTESYRTLLLGFWKGHLETSLLASLKSVGSQIGWSRVIQLEEACFPNSPISSAVLGREVWVDRPSDSIVIKKGSLGPTHIWLLSWWDKYKLWFIFSWGDEFAKPHSYDT